MVQELDISEQIKKAIGAHGMWKQQLKTAVHTGKSDRTVDYVRRDDQCEFGKWLCASPQLQTSRHYARVKELHRNFHAEVGSVLQIALAGDRAKAEKLLETGSAFAKASLDLTSEMMAWSREKQ